MRIFITAIAITTTLALTTPAALAFEIGFDWKGLKLCTTGNPNRVHNPRFIVKDVPAGTKYIRFKLVDRDAPGYNHGGGVVAYTGQSAIEPGAFKYKSPCPPSGRHTYIWTATAQSRKNGGKLDVAKAARKYP
jgi:phosphatidylethanolamine-binding protein (PEBP) family uncharacterized protein